MKLIAYCLLLILFFRTWAVGSTPAEFDEHFKLLPQPQKIDLLPGKGLVYTDLRGIYLENTGNKPVMTGLLADLPRVGNRTFGSVSLVINANLGLVPEGYQLDVADSKVTIQAMDAAGLFYGIQTLKQLLEDAQDQQIEIPACG